MSRARQNLRKRANQLHVATEALPKGGEAIVESTMEWRRLRERMGRDTLAPGPTVRT